MVLLAFCPAALHAQQFAQVAPLSFTKVFGGADPLPQTISVANVGTAFNFSDSVSTSSGGTWLSATVCNLCAAPHVVTVTVQPLVTLAAGTYSGQVVLTSQGGAVSMTVPVTLTIAAAGTAFLDNLAGQMSFFVSTGRADSTSQDIQVRNGGAGTLNWTLAKSTADGGNWLTVSASSGTAPTLITVGVNVANLPGGGLTAGTFVGNLLITGGSTSVTVPVSVFVGNATFYQVNPINFTKVFAGADPLPQILTVPSNGTAFNFYATAVTATGGNWLSVSPVCNLCATPRAVTAIVTTSPTMAVGTYTGQILFRSQNGAMSITVSVTLTVAPAASSYFDNVPGQMSFYLKTNGTIVTTQDLEIRNGGQGTLNWTLTGSTADGGNWLNFSLTSGTAPSIVTVGVQVASLPNAGLVAGTFVGQLVFRASGSSVTVPVTVVVGDDVFNQVNAINFTKPYAGADPLPQNLTIATTGASFNFYATSSTATGGDWLSISPVCNLCAAPHTVTAIVTTSPSMAVGTYTGQILITSQNGAMSIIIPVTLTVAPTNLPYFDNVPGQMSFSIQTGSSGNPPSQSVNIRNAGPGTLSWTLDTSTSDGGNWLTASALSGTAPSSVTVSVLTQNLPNLGLIAGTFTGELVFRTNGSSVTVSVSVVVGDNILAQVNAISFTKPQNGADPLPQILTFASTGTSFNFYTTASSATGGNWLSITPICNLCAAPRAVVAKVSASPTLGPGTYTGQIVVTTQSGSMSLTVPVTLTVEPPASAFFDNVQGQIGFSFVTGSGNPPTQNVQIRNGGAGSLNWSLSTMTADGGNWLTVSASNGTAPANVAVGVNVANLPNLGLVAGTFTGRLLFHSTTGDVTIPVSVTVGPNVFVPLSALSFSTTSGGTNPLPQTLTVSSTGAAFNFYALSYNATGGNWLSISPVCNLCATPRAVSTMVAASPTLGAGTYTGQVVFTSQSGGMAMTVPVILNVTGPTTLTITKTHSGNFMQGQAGATYTVTVHDTGGTTSGTVTVTETVPAGMTLVSMAGTGWSCPTGGNTCTRSDVLTAGASYPSITVTVNVAGNASSPLVNGVSVSGGGSATATATDSTVINPPSALLGISKTHINSFWRGQLNASYSVIVTNTIGAGPTSGTVTVTESVPTGMTLVSMAGTGWTCPNGGTTCTRTDPLSGGSSYPPITVTVSIASNAPASLTNLVSVSGGGSPSANVGDLTLITPPPVALRFVPLPPCRVADTRKPNGPFGGPQIPGGGTRDFIIPNSACGVPATAQAYSLNVAVVPSGPLGYLTVWPAGQAQPVASTLNSLDGRIKSNAAIVPAGSGGAVTVFASNPTQVVLDINGYFVPATDPTALAFYPVTPCRVVDTRKPTAPLGGPSLTGGQGRTFPILSASACNIPATAQAYSLNFAAVPPGPLGYLTAWPTGQAQPVVASLNALTGTVTANAAIVPAGTGGAIDIFASNTTNLVIDINGYFAPAATGGLSLYNVTPCRVLDSRKPAGTPPFSGALDISVAGSACGIPVASQAYVLSATVVPPGALGYLSLWPQGQSQPVVSTLNALDGAVTSNLALVPTTNGSVSVFASNPTHLVLDISGYFAQ